MGEVEIDHATGSIVIRSHIVTYGSESGADITERIRNEIERMWNEPSPVIFMNRSHYRLRFIITSSSRQGVPEQDVANEIIQNVDPRNNYFRIEPFVHGDISFVDGVKCNTGYFKADNLYDGSTTAAHEYGHTIGLDHPKILDLRGQGTPGIMYPRGTIVDPQFQYDPTKPPGVTGGTMHPMHRRVTQEDIDLLKIPRLSFVDNRAIIGEFTNIYHWNHAAKNQR